MSAWKAPGRTLAAIAAFYALVFAGRAGWDRYRLAVRLETGKRAYFHDEFVDVRLRTRDAGLLARWKDSPPRATVLREGKPVATIGGLVELPLSFDPSQGAFTGRWPCPWNADAGRYDLALAGDGDVAGRVRSPPFAVLHRKPATLPAGLTVLTLESADPWRQMKVRAPDGQLKDWRGMLDWAQYIHADAFWVLGGQTPGRKPGEVWASDNLDVIPEMAKEAHARGLKFGVYVECYLTMSKRRLDRYQYALDVADGRPAVTRAISLGDPRRVEDVIALLKRFRDVPEVDYLGLDYIRNALGGYELAERFYAEMPGVHPPPGWARLSKDERILYFARKKVMRRDLAFIDSWQWWRAHEVGAIVRRVKTELATKKPLWAFTLTWDKGHQHGQDPVMMNDAGVDADALMLYQADKAQFAGIMHDFHSYLKRGDVQLVVGEIIDWPLHQNDPQGPLELYRRATEAIDHIYADGPANGVFFHDVNRALTGRLGPWGTRGWMDQARRAADHMKRLSAPLPASS